MQMPTHNLTRITGSFRLCVWDMLIALMALHFALFVVHHDVRDLDVSLFQTDKPKLFLVIVALPSMLVGIILTHATHIQRLALHFVKTLLSMFISYIMYIACTEWHQPRLLGELEFVWGLSLFAVMDSFYEIACSNHGQNRKGGNVLLVGSGPLARCTVDLIGTSPARFKLAGKVEYPNPEEDMPDLDSVEILGIAERVQATHVAISIKERRGIFPLKAMLACKLSGIEVLDVPGLYERITGKLLIENITPSWFIFCHGFTVTRLLRFCKRLLDISLASAGLFFCAPFGVLMALAIKIDSLGPIFSRQARVGQDDKNFSIIKFRSMRQDAEKGSEAVWAERNDARVTRLGYFLRKYRIDEIPQLINVLKGEMSLVGPRPKRPEFVETLKTNIPCYSERHYVKLGVTGWVQVCYP